MAEKVTVPNTSAPVVLLMGPTASGKTDLAIQLHERLQCDIVSVDSAQVYKGMDIGTAKPDAATLRQAPHQLIDIRDPEVSYSAGEFVRDARGAIAVSHQQGRIPLLAGGTMMYFRALTGGIAELPAANAEIRGAIDELARDKGWPFVHAQLAEVDPETSNRLDPNDSQRVQRALEVFRISGKPLSRWHAESPAKTDSSLNFIKVGLQVEPRSLLHGRIEQRLDQIIESGFEDEVRTLRERQGLRQDSPAMRSVGYRQFWKYLDGEYDLDEARLRTLFATRQLAKRQLTWLRSEDEVFSVDPLERNAVGTILSYLVEFFDA